MYDLNTREFGITLLRFGNASGKALTACQAMLSRCKMTKFLYLNAHTLCVPALAISAFLQRRFGPSQRFATKFFKNRLKIEADQLRPVTPASPFTFAVMVEMTPAARHFPS